MIDKKNFRVDWVIPGHVAGLTHYTSNVTQDELMQIMTETTALLESAENPVHFIINNRMMDMDYTIPLEQMKQAAPFIGHPLLRSLIVIVSEKLGKDANDIPVETDANLTYKHVNTVSDAAAYLTTLDPTLDWTPDCTAFFE